MLHYALINKWVAVPTEKKGWILTMAYVKIRPRRGTKAQWEAANPILSEGEIAFEVPDEGVGTGLVNFKLGDNVTPWNDLPYAFAARTTVQNVQDLEELTNDMSEDLSQLSTDMATLKEMAETLRRVDVQSAEPGSPTIGQVWIATDAVNGSLTLNETNVNLTVGDEAFKFTVQNTLSLCDSVQWSLNFEGSNECAEIVDQGNSNSNAYCYVIGKYAGTVRVIATAVYDNATVYRVSANVSVVQAGSIDLSIVADRLIVGKSTTAMYTVQDGLPYDEGGITWSVSDASYLELTNKIDNRCTVTATKAAGQQIYVVITAKYRGTTIYTTRKGITTVGLSLSQNAVSLQAGNSTQITIYNSMVKGVDYTDIVYSVEDSSVTMITDATDNSFTVTAGAKAGTKAVTLIAKLGDQEIQRMTLSVTVIGRLTVEPTQITNMNVGDETYTIRLSNSLGDAADGIVWETTPSDAPIVSLNGSSTGCVVRAIRAGTGVVWAYATYNGVKLNSAAAKASCVVIAKGSIFFPSTTPTVYTIGQTTDVRLSCTLLAGQDYYAIQWSGSGLNITVDADGLVAHIQPTAIGNTTLIARAADSIGNVVSTASLNITCVAQKVQGTLSLSPGSVTVPEGGTVTINTVNTYTYGEDYDTVSWSVLRGSSSDPYYAVATANRSNTSCEFQGLEPGICTAQCTLILAGDVIATATCVLTVQGHIEFASSISSGNVGETVILSIENTLVPGTWQRYVWELSSSSYGSFVIPDGSSWTATGDTTGVCRVQLGPNSGNLVVSCTAYDSHNNIVGETSGAGLATCPIEVRGAVQIRTDNGTVYDQYNNLINHHVGDEQFEIAAVNEMASSQFTRFEWTVNQNGIIQLADVTKTSVKVRPIGIGLVTLTYSVYNGSILIKESSVPILVQGDMTVDAISTPVINIGDRISANGNSSLISWDENPLVYEWKSSNPAIASIATNSANTLNATITGVSKGENISIYLEAVSYIYNESTATTDRVVRYTTDLAGQPERKVTVLGGASINTSNLETPLNQGDEIDVALISDMTPGTWDNIIWGSSDTTIFEIAVNESDNTRATLTANGAGTGTITAVVRDANNEALKTLTATVVVNGKVQIAAESVILKMFAGSETVNANNSLISGTYDDFKWTSSDTNVFTVDYTANTGNEENNPDVALTSTLNPVAVGNARLTIQATKNGTDVYSPDYINVTVEPGLRINIPSGSPSYLNPGETLTVTLDNTYTSVQYDELKWSVDPAASATVTPNTNGATVTAVARGEGVTVTAELLDNEQNQIDVASFEVSVQGELTLQNPAAGLELEDNAGSFDLVATSTLLEWSYNTSDATGGFVWESSDDTVITLQQSTENYLMATATVLTAGSATITIKAVDGDGLTVASSSLVFTVTAHTEP